MNKIQKRRDKKQNIGRKTSGNKFIIRLLLICLELFLLISAVGFLILFLLKDEPVVAKIPLVEYVINRNDQQKATEEENDLEGKEGIWTEDGKTVLTFAGDVSFADDYTNMYLLKKRKNGIKDCFDEFVMKEMQDADLFMINNEFTYTNRGTPTEGKSYTFRSNPENVRLLTEMGVDLVSLANNHAYDYGEISLLDSMDTLEKEGIYFGGAGKNKEEAMKPVRFTINGRNISYICATQVEQMDYPDTKGATETSPGVFRCWNDDSIYDVIRECDKNGDFVICFIHWGQELKEELHWAQPNQAKKMVEAGADFIVGAHPHILQGIDYIEGIPVIYSLGNFWFNSKTQDTGLLKLILNEEGIESLRFLPAIQEGCVTTIAGEVDQNRILSHLRELSPNVNIDETGVISAK